MYSFGTDVPKKYGDTIPITRDKFRGKARPTRIVVPGLPHHVTQRGNRREAIFFTEGDHEIYKDLLAEQARKWRVEVWAYCLMPNHVHLTMVPETEDGRGRAFEPTLRGRMTNW